MIDDAHEKTARKVMEAIEMGRRTARGAPEAAALDAQEDAILRQLVALEALRPLRMIVLPDGSFIVQTVPFEGGAAKLEEGLKAFLETIEQARRTPGAHLLGRPGGPVRRA
jgi:hypothetical protein